MKLVSTSNFRNPQPGKITVAGALHPQHIHKGARFEIGGDAPFDKVEPDDKRLVTLLNTAGRIVEASQVELVAQIDAEVSFAAKLQRK